MSPWIRSTYAVLLLGAVCVAWALTRYKQRKLKLSAKERWMLGISAFIGSMLGAKVPFLLERGWNAVYDGTAWFADGKTILGGIFGGYLAVELAKWIAKIQTRTGDSFALPIAIAVAVGRIGCFLAGCCYGSETRVPWGIEFPTAHDAPGVLRHPTQLYEFVFHSLSAVALVWISNRNWFVHNQLKLYLIAYLIFRFFSEWLRPESPVLLNLTTYQIASVILIAILVVLWVKGNTESRSKSDDIHPSAVNSTPCS